jgi:hypothetical protein
MRIAEILNAMASWLESPNNEALLLAEYDENCLKVVAESCVLAAALLKTAAEQVEVIEPAEESHLTPESLQELADIATAFDASGDDKLKKQASVIDELLLTIASPPGANAERLDREGRRIEELRKMYETPREELEKANKIADSKNAIEKSKMTSQPKHSYEPLQTRSCPDHPGSSMFRAGDGIFGCSLDHKLYDYNNGYTLQNGTHVPGGNVNLQSNTINDGESHAIFDSRVERLQGNKV